MNRFVFAIAFAITAAAGCVSDERSDVATARVAYDQCVADQAGGDRDCTALRERLLAAQQRYESNARRAWGCAPEQGDCPAHR
jgi:outer membrane murein-binding lipoprotein Lpp